MSNKIKMSFNRAKQHLNGKYLAILFIGLLILTLSELASNKPVANFWFCMYTSLTGTLTNLGLFTLLIINVFFYNREFKTDYILYNRYGNYEKKIKKDMLSIIIMSLILFLVYLILTVSVSVVDSLNNFNSLEYIYYEIDSKIYIFFSIVRLTSFVILIPLIVYIITLIKNKIVYTVLMAIILSSLMVPLSTGIAITSFFESPITFMGYLCSLKFSSFQTEIVYSIIVFAIYLLIFGIAYTYRISKKVDI